MQKLVRIAFVGVVAIVSLAGTPTAPASAAPSPSGILQFQQFITARAAPNVTNSTMRCPFGYRMVGSGSGNGQLLAVAPTADFSGATTVALVTQPAPNNLLYQTVTCAPPSQFTDVITSVTVDHGVREGTFQRDVGRCPLGYYAFGGGGFFHSFTFGVLGSDDNNVSNAPSADGNGWTFAGMVPTGADTMEIDIECAPRTGRDFLVQFGSVSSGLNSFTNSYADCPAGYTAIAGGYYISNPNGTEATPGNVQYSMPTMSHIAGISSWYAAAYAPAGTKLVALAQCLR